MPIVQRRAFMRCERTHIDDVAKLGMFVHVYVCIHTFCSWLSMTLATLCVYMYVYINSAVGIDDVGQLCMCVHVRVCIRIFFKSPNKIQESVFLRVCIDCNLLKYIYACIHVICTACMHWACIYACMHVCMCITHRSVNAQPCSWLTAMAWSRSRSRSQS